MKHTIQIVILLFLNFSTAQTIIIADSLNLEPIPFATISFGNGLALPTTRGADLFPHLFIKGFIMIARA